MIACGFDTNVLSSSTDSTCFNFSTHEAKDLWPQLSVKIVDNYGRGWDGRENPGGKSHERFEQGLGGTGGVETEANPSRRQIETIIEVAAAFMRSLGWHCPPGVCCWYSQQPLSNYRAHGRRCKTVCSVVLTPRRLVCRVWDLPVVLSYSGCPRGIQS